MHGWESSEDAVKPVKLLFTNHNRRKMKNGNQFKSSRHSKMVRFHDFTRLSDWMASKKRHKDQITNLSFFVHLHKGIEQQLPPPPPQAHHVHQGTYAKKITETNCRCMLLR
ncbi:hypothetical protein E2C01_046247 [Portunus trituberculatus]|uniref:Uncharacterized protein n=1 Tax=Portunus trituberculatus TaxID=210409 RepID=A0A5B7G499_PORTR|nr:hypothetical protein [Portunus trituberculatus]